MHQQDRTKEQLVREVAGLRERISLLEAAEAEGERLEKALREERDFITAVLRTAGALVVVLDPRGRIVRFNRACEQATGRSFDEVKGKHVWDLFVIAEEVPPVKAVFDQLRAGQFPNRHENYWVARDGRRRLIAWSNTALVNREGAVEYVIGTGIDITERREAEEALRTARDELEVTVRKRTAQLTAANRQLHQEVAERQKAEEALRKSEERFRRLFEQSNDAVFLHSLDGTLLDVNRRACEMLGYDREQILAMRVPALHPEEEMPAADRALETTREQGSIRFPSRFQRADGTIIDVEISARIVDRQQGIVQGIVRDITQAKQDEAKLKQALAKLRQSNQDLMQFTYSASHDLQEPLRMISSYLQALKKRSHEVLDENARSLVRVSVDTAARMQRLISDLLSYAHVGSCPKRFDTVDVGAVVGQVLADLEASIQEQGADVSRGRLPAVTGDATLLAQLFQNLIGNALKFHGCEPPRVRISAESAGRTWVFSVEDSGIGIDPEYVERIFSVFERLHPSDEYPGTGIGLAIAKRVVERHGGRIWCESEPGKGTTFRFTIPKDQSKLEPAETP